MKRILIYILVGLPLALQAQTALTLEKCIQMAKDNNKRTEAAEQQYLASRYERRSTKALFLPSFSLTGNALYSTSDGSYSSGNGQLPVLGADGMPTGQFAFFPGIDLSYGLDWIYSGGIKVEQPIYMGGKIRAGYRMAKIGNEMAWQNKRLTEAEIIVETSRAYAEAVRTQELTQVATSYHRLLTELMRTVESARKHGMKSQNDVLKVKVKLDESELNLRRAENGYRLARMNLCHYIGLPLTEQIEIENVLPHTDDTGERASDIYNRPEYRLLEQKTEMARQKVNVARSEHLPQIGLTGQYGYTNGIELNGQRMLEMTQSFNNLDEAMLETKLAESSVASADENLRTSRLQYEKGVELLSDYLEAQTLWQQARQTHVNARVNCYLKWLEYQRATGKIN